MVPWQAEGAVCQAKGSHVDFAKPSTRYDYNKADFDSALEELIQHPIHSADG